eukprot:349678-Chlamydomonas_euryale.AAC.5
MPPLCMHCRVSKSAAITGLLPTSRATPAPCTSAVSGGLIVTDNTGIADTLVACHAGVSAGGPWKAARATRQLC